jgi:hypothetical protein
LRKDIIKVLGDDPEDVYPTLEELRAIPYMDCVIKEVKEVIVYRRFHAF